MGGVHLTALAIGFRVKVWRMVTMTMMMTTTLKFVSALVIAQVAPSKEAPCDGGNSADAILQMISPSLVVVLVPGKRVRLLLPFLWALMNGKERGVVSTPQDRNFCRHCLVVSVVQMLNQEVQRALHRTEELLQALLS